MIEQEIENLLRELGLDELEIRCYLSLLKSGARRAGEMSFEFNIPKATVLLALSNLFEKFNLIKRDKIKNYYVFFVQDVGEISSFLKKRIEENQRNYEKVSNLLPQIRFLQESADQKPKILYFEGNDGLKKALDFSLNEAKEIVAHLDAESESAGLAEVYPNYHEKRVDKKIIFSRVLSPNSQFNIEETAKNSARDLKSVSFLPKGNNFSVDIYIYNDTVAIFSFKEKYALLIKNNLLAGCLRAIFTIAYAKSEEFPTRGLRSHSFDRYVKN